ncbi:phage minor head protein [Streptomyces tanashiensis]|uniref:phage minor head protein n=1 Tax=Streptomyces tanashiensis TaxID=67367 RepID=UPI0033E31E52
MSTYLNDAGNRLVRLPDEVYGLIVAELERGIREQESIPDIAARVSTVLTATGSERWPHRAVTVARTETMAAVNGGVWRSAQLEAEQRGDPAPFKQWVSTADPRTRETHREADKQRTLLTEPFRVGGAQLLFPGDPTGPANEVINCRCSMFPVVLGEEIDWTDRQDP